LLNTHQRLLFKAAFFIYTRISDLHYDTYTLVAQAVVPVCTGVKGGGGEECVGVYAWNNGQLCAYLLCFLCLLPTIHY